MITQKNDFIFQLQKRVIVEMQQHLQWGAVTIPSFRGDFSSSFEEANVIMQWAQEAVAALESLKVKRDTDDRIP